MSDRTYTCTKPNCWHCYELKRIESLNKTRIEIDKQNAAKATTCYKRLITGLKTNV